jgi:hypothetical protein
LDDLRSEQPIERLEGAIPRSFLGQAIFVHEGWHDDLGDVEEVPLLARTGMPGRRAAAVTS